MKFVNQLFLLVVVNSWSVKHKRSYFLEVVGFCENSCELVERGTAALWDSIVEDLSRKIFV